MLAILERYRFDIRSCNKDYSKIRKAITAGFFNKTARKDAEGYKTLVDDQTVYIHPSSSLF